MNAKRFSVSLLLSTVVMSTWLIGQAPAQEMQEKSLYQRLGGYDAIAVVTDEFITRLATDKQFERFFTSLSLDSKKRLRQHIVNQICQITGGPCVYTGRDMKTAHAGLGITEAEWQASVHHLIAALDKFKVPKKEKDELLAGVSTLKRTSSRKRRRRRSNACLFIDNALVIRRADRTGLGAVESARALSRLVAGVRAGGARLRRTRRHRCRLSLSWCAAVPAWCLIFT